MGVGTIATTVPVANDILQGELKTYYNYDLPTQLLIGATNGGAKLNLDREIRPVAIDGVFGMQLSSAGIPLVRYTRFSIKLTLEQLYLKYIRQLILSTAESDDAWESGDWVETGGTYTAETTIVNAGSQSAKMTADTSQYGIKKVFTSSKDLTAFDNGEASDTGDYIGFSIYITTQDLTDLGTADLRITFHMDADETETNYYYYDVAASALTANQWNNFKVAKSSFTETGTGDWSTVTGISLKLDAAPSAEVVCYIDEVTLIQNQSNSAIVGLNGGNFDYTDETTYRLIKPDLEITPYDYIHNVTMIGQKMDGKMFKIKLLRCLNDGEIDIAFEEKNEAVNSTQFTAHYSQSSGLTIPIELYEYVA